jgi:hypothetical protein
MRQNILIIAGLLGFLLGVLFMLQGLGIVRWPATSTMIDSRVWVTRGGILALLSAILVAGARLAPTRTERKAARRADRF